MMLKAEIIRYALAGDPDHRVAAFDLVHRDGQKLTVRHAWAEVVDGRVLSFIVDRAMAEAFAIAEETGRFVDVFWRNGSRLGVAGPLPAGAKRIAAVGSDGTRLVVWGLSATEAEAREDAARWLDGAEVELGFHTIDAAHVERVRAGDVAWPGEVTS